MRHSRWVFQSHQLTLPFFSELLMLFIIIKLPNTIALSFTTDLVRIGNGNMDLRKNDFASLLPNLGLPQ